MTVTPVPQIYDTARRVARTVLQVVGGFLVLAPIYPLIVEAIGFPRTSNIGLWMAASVAVVAAVAAALTRVMAIPAVNRWLSKVRLGGHSGNVQAGDTYTSLLQVHTPAPADPQN